MKTTTYYPEMGEAKPECQFEASMNYDSSWRVKSPTPLPGGRGITLQQIYKSSDLVPEAQHKVGWHVYRLTPRAFEQLKGAASVEILLD